MKNSSKQWNTVDHMRAGLAQSTVTRPSKALVLGTPSVARRIAEDLRAFGIDAEIESDLTERAGLIPPFPSAFDAQTKFRTYLRDCEKLLGGLSLLHPGVSAWADRSDLPLICQEMGIEVVCPPPRIMSLFGNKLNLLMEAEKAKVPHLVLSFDPIQSVRETEKLMQSMPDSMRPPFVLKSVRGGGAGIGVRVVHSLQEMEKTLPLWLEQLRSRFGEAILFPERYLEGALYLIQPFARFADGTMEFFPAVDASLQYRYRKLVEFCPVPNLDKDVQERLKRWTRALAEQVSYVGVGALEFLVEGAQGFLIEGLARLNTGYHLWEKVAGTSAVAWQLATLRDESPSALPPKAVEKDWVSGISLRIHAEDPVLQIPQPGQVRELSEQNQWNTLTGTAQIDWSVAAGGEVENSSDGLLGLVWVGGRSRATALQLAEEVLSGIWVGGSLHTNERFLAELIQHPWVKDGIYHAGFVDEEFIPLVRPPLQFLKTAISVCSQASEAGSTWTASGIRLEPKDLVLDWEETPQHWIYSGMRGCSGRVRLSTGESVRVCAYPLTRDRWQVRVGAWWVAVRRWEKGATPQLYALAQGKVHSIHFREGTVAAAHETILMLESLRLLVPHAVPVDVRVERWKVKPGDVVSLGQSLADLEKVKKEP